MITKRRVSEDDEQAAEPKKRRKEKEFELNRVPVLLKLLPHVRDTVSELRACS